VTWFRRGRQHITADTAPPPDPDDPVELRDTLRAMIRFINQNSGHLPGAAVVAARFVTDTLDDIIETSQVRPLDVYAVITVRSTLDDYLPTSLRRYLALEAQVRDRPLPSGRTPTESLLEQLDSLQTAADAVLVAARDQDANALIAQGTFLRTKFSGSDLDL
jgi:hypothetical protein